MILQTAVEAQEWGWHTFREAGMNRFLRALAALILFCGLFLAMLAPLGRAEAHTKNRLWATQLEAGRTMTLDGDCSLVEYAQSANYLIYYAPRIEETPPAHVQAVWNDQYLYICFSSLLVDTEYNDLVTVAFDLQNNGTAHPQTDDVWFASGHEGAVTPQRGTGSGFTPDSSLTSMFNKYSGYQSETEYQVEFRFNRSLFSDGKGGFYSPGVHVRHNWLLWQGDDYGYPSAAYWDGPQTWADLQWGTTSTTTMNVFPDVMRITQGLDYETANGRTTAYELIAGKDTLLRVQAYTFGVITAVTGGSCQVQQLSHLSNSGVFTPVSSGVINVPIALSPLPVILARPVGYFDGTNTLDCWVPAGVLSDPGQYSFRITVNRVGAVSNSFSIGTRTFYPTADVRVLLYPAVFPTIHSEYRLWDANLWSEVFSGLRQYARFNPYHSGAGLVDQSGTGGPVLLGGKPGVRYLPYASPYYCVVRVGESLSQAGSRCDNEARATANRLIGEFNAEMFYRDTVYPGAVPRDRIDWAAVLFATPRTGGGQSCHFSRGERSVGEGVDTVVRDAYGNYTAGGSNGLLIGHELDHCMGLVASSSPNADGGAHTRQGNIWITGSQMINMETRQSVPHPGSHMYAYFAYGTDGKEYLSAVEWNQLRTTLLTMARPPMPPGRPQAGAPEPSSQLFQMSATVDLSENLSLISSQVVENLALEETVEAESPTYMLQFIDKFDTIIFSYGLDPFAASPDDPTPAYGSFYLVVPFPEGAVRIQIQNIKTSAVIYAQVFTDSSPQITDVDLETSLNGKGPSILASLTWTGSDPDSPGLTYAIFLIPADGEAPLLLKDGLTDESFDFTTDFAPASTSARLKIEASDGLHTATATSEAFTIPQNPPVVDISAPDAFGTFVAGVPVQLAGTAFDFSGGAIDPQDLTWSSDLDGTLGHGEALTTTLSAGEHIITFQGAVSGQIGVDSVTIQVGADSDQDGLPDDYEGNHPTCLDPATIDSQEDPDSDGLVNRGEFLNFTEPCLPDTDGDGYGDGEETASGSDPNGYDSVPPVPAFFVQDDSLYLGMCPSPQSGVIHLETGTAQAWNLDVSETWISAPPSGTGSQDIQLEAVCGDLPAAQYIGQAFLSAEGVEPRSVEVVLDVGWSVYLPVVKR